MLSQAYLGVRSQPNVYTPNSRLRDFMRMNPPTFHGTMVDEDLQCFMNEVFQVVDSISVTPRRIVELAAYKLKDVKKVWFE